MIKSFITVVVGFLTLVNANCMSGHPAVSCVDILNSTGNSVQLAHVDVESDISAITKKSVDTKNFEISDGIEFTLAELVSRFQSICNKKRF
jgi:hypothetical protein